MNWWLFAGALLAAYCAVGHELVGGRLYYRPMRPLVQDETLASVLAGVWRLVTIDFAFCAIALFIAALPVGRSIFGPAGQSALAWLAAAQFAAVAILFLILSVRLGAVFRLFQWTLFALVAVVAVIGIRMGH